VLLTLALLPALETTATKTGAPTRVTWTGSRTHVYSSLAGKKHDQRLNKEESVLKHLDTADDQSMFVRYANSKLLCVIFQLELAWHYPLDRVIVNSFCPGQVDTNMTDVLPIYLRIPVNAVKAIRARSPKKAAWIALNAAVLAGAETHGRLLGDMVFREAWEFIKTEDGQRVQKTLWNDCRRDGWDGQSAFLDEQAGVDCVPVSREWNTRLLKRE
jgi:NAD(P)-dependent dehydrogenase (short-subunit alcohol dehydrogenase family)